MPVNPSKRKVGGNFGELDIEAVMAQATNKVQAVALAEELAKRGADEQDLVYILDRDWTKKGSGSLSPTAPFPNVNSFTKA